MALKPEASMLGGLAVITLVYGTYQMALPNVADARTAEVADPDLESAERLATVTAAGIVAGVSLITKDMGIFVLGGSAVIVLAWWHRYARMVDPATGKVSELISGIRLAPAPASEPATAASF
jgi:4-amino-4-deoxy-L-arabinose transferase-like glycosyltransferase